MLHLGQIPRLDAWEASLDPLSGYRELLFEDAEMPFQTQAGHSFSIAIRERRVQLVRSYSTVWLYLMLCCRWESDAKVLIPQAACKFAGIKTRAMSHLFAWIKLFSILERILDNIGAFRKLGANQRLTELATLDSALETWYKQHSDSASFTNPPTVRPVSFPLQF